MPSLAVAQEDDYEEWRRNQEQQYQEYLNEQDKAFLKFLKKQWKDVDVDAEVGSAIDNKPDETPTVTGIDLESAPSETPERPSQPAPSDESTPPEPSGAESSPDPSQTGPSQEGEQEESEEQPSQASPEPSQRPTDRQTESAEGMSQASLPFFGLQTAVPYRPGLLPSMDGSVGKESIRTYWRSMAEEEYTPTLDAVQNKREEIGLSDWGYYIYLRDLGDRLYETTGRSQGANEATLWTWFMMMKSGYSVRVGYRDDEVFLLLPVDGQIFNRPQLHIDGQRYYLMVEESGDGSLRTYEGQHDAADDVLQLDERVLPSLGESTGSRSASFSYDGDRYDVEFEYNTAVLDYLRAYPNVELEVLFEAGVSSVAESSLTEALRPHLRDRSPRDALNFLLRFVQFATDYERDQENFGEERFLFAEESLAEPASDCEDRAVLFAYLARTLLDRDLVGLHWPGHVATAVKVGNGLDAASDDRTFRVDGATYILADPTYIGSSLGMEMPFVEGKEADIISLRP